ncbi:MYSM1-like protein, partial [Mya arenaria]
MEVTEEERNVMSEFFDACSKGNQCMYKTPRSLPIPNSGIRGKNKTSSTYDVEKRESGHGDDGSAPLELFKLSDPQYLSILVSEARKEKKQPSPNADRRRQMRKPVVTLFKDQYDPFKLIPCLPFSSDKPPPFKVEIHCSSLMIMDMHSHISKTEVIGMLGGRYCPGRGKLTVVQAIPCKSVSTGMQCEMDPDIPYKFDFSQYPCSEEDVTKVIQCAKMLVSTYRKDPNHVDLGLAYTLTHYPDAKHRHMSCLDKMLESLEAYDVLYDQGFLISSLRAEFSHLSHSTLSIDFANSELRHHCRIKVDIQRGNLATAVDFGRKWDRTGVGG